MTILQSEKCRIFKKTSKQDKENATLGNFESFAVLTQNKRETRILCPYLLANTHHSSSLSSHESTGFMQKFKKFLLFIDNSLWVW